VIEQDRQADERGYFARTWYAEELAAHALANLAQCSVSFNDRSSTLPGMHYQARAFAKVKLVRGVRYDDPFFGVAWPGRVEVIAARDRDCRDVTLELLDLP